MEWESKPNWRTLVELKNALPESVPPMMAASVKEPFDDPGWIFETKLDGYRAIEATNCAVGVLRV
jgi:ATP-dependent DNA ligase